MYTFTVEVRVPDELREQFEARVQAYGGAQERYLMDLLERDLRPLTPDAGLTFQELLSAASGPSPADEMSDEELTEYVEAEVRAYRAEKRSKVKRA